MRNDKTYLNEPYMSTSLKGQNEKEELISDLTRDDVIEMLKDIFEEQRELTDEEMQAYKNMLRRKEKDMELIRGRKTPLKNAIVISDDMGVMNVETAIKHIRRALDVPNRDGFALVDDEALFKALEILTYVHIVMEEQGE